MDMINFYYFLLCADPELFFPSQGLQADDNYR